MAPKTSRSKEHTVCMLKISEEWDSVAINHEEIVRLSDDILKLKDLIKN